MGIYARICHFLFLYYVTRFLQSASAFDGSYKRFITQRNITGEK